MNPETPASSHAESAPLAANLPAATVSPPPMEDDLGLDGETLGERQPETLQPITCSGGCE
jgi:hypothetical protein